MSTGEGRSRMGVYKPIVPLFTEQALVTYLNGDRAGWSMQTDQILQSGYGEFAGLTLDDTQNNPYGDAVQ